jgi:hypothetical protein
MTTKNPPTKNPAELLKEFIIEHDLKLTPDQLGELFNIGLAYWQKGFKDCKSAVFAKPNNLNKE